ncbi:MAG: hypothetical protein RLP15_00070 [Cryomorphaceae bacterium]
MKNALLLAFVVVWTNASGQADRWWAQYHFTGAPDIERANLWIDAEYEMKSNRLNNEITGTLLNGSTLDASTTGYLIEEPSQSKTRLAGGIEANAWFRSNGSGTLHWHVGGGITDKAYSSFSTGLVQLVLNGNGPYEDKRLPLGPSWLRYMSAQSIGVGVDFETDNMVVGMTANLSKVSRWHSINVASGSLYTAPYGASIDADITGSRNSTAFSQNKVSAWYGSGLSVGLFLINHPAPGKLLVSAQVRDLGLIHFSGITNEQVSLDTSFSGLNADEILTHGPSFSNGGSLDSLEGLIGIVRSNQGHTALYPGFIQMDVVQPLGEQLSFAVQLRQYFLAAPPGIRLGMRIRLTHWIALEPYCLAGAFTRFDTGLTASLNPGNGLRVQLVYGMLESQIARTATRSQHLRFMISIDI